MRNLTDAFGANLKRIRKSRGLTQEKLSELIGINQRQLARIEAGSSFVTAATIENICNSLEVSTQELFDFDLREEYLKTGTDGYISLNSIKNDKKMTFMTQNVVVEKSPTQTTTDNVMIATAKRLNKPLVVEEMEDNEVNCVKIYYPNGEIKEKRIEHSNPDLEFINQELMKIIDNPKKLEFIKLAFNALTDKDRLDELKAMIKGIELTL